MEDEKNIGSYKYPKHESQLIKVKYIGKGGENECNICLEQYALDQAVIYLPCLHTYHDNCILEWLRKPHETPACPICQEKVYEK